MPPVAPPSHEDETFTLKLRDPSRVLQYRFDELLRLGVDAADADKLTRLRDVHHTVADLIAGGCPAHLAARIVSPL